MPDLVGDFDAVQEHVGHAQKVRHGLLLDAVDLLLQLGPLLGRLDVLGAHVLDRARQEAAGPTGWVEDLLS